MTAKTNYYFCTISGDFSGFTRETKGSGGEAGFKNDDRKAA